MVQPWNAEESFPAFMRLKYRRAWQDWHRTLLRGATTLQIGDEGLWVDFRTTDEHIGAQVALRCGLDQEPVELEATTGSLHFALPEGESACELDAPQGTWLARAEGDGPRWGRRTLFRADQQDLRVMVPRRSPEEVLFIRAYTPSGRAPTLRVLVDEGEPERSPVPTEEYTQVEREFVPQEQRESAQLVNGGTLVGWQAMRVVLRADLAPGTHQLRLHAEGVGGEPVYVRMDGTWIQAREAGLRHWTEDQL